MLRTDYNWTSTIIVYIFLFIIAFKHIQCLEQNNMKQITLNTLYLYILTSQIKLHYLLLKHLSVFFIAFLKWIYNYVAQNNELFLFLFFTELYMYSGAIFLCYSFSSLFLCVHHYESNNLFMFTFHHIRFSTLQTVAYCHHFTFHLLINYFMLVFVYNQIFIFINSSIY